MKYEVVFGRLPTIPEYFQHQINSSVDLADEPKQPSPWRKEDKPSFSYSAEKEIWKDFGGSKASGKVIDLHRVNFHLRDNEEAERSLKALYRVKDKPPEQLSVEEIDFNIAKIARESVYQKLLLKANTIDRWLELDYTMSKVPINTNDLQELLKQWED